MSNIVERVFLQVVADKLWRDINDITVCKNVTKMGFFDAVGAGVLSIVSVVMSLENIFDINFTDEEIYSLTRMSYSEILNVLVSAGASAESMQRSAARKKIKPVVEKKQAREGVKSEKQNKPVVVLRTMKDGKPYCELMGKKCNRSKRINTTGKDYCEFINCVIYKNFQRLR